MHNSRQTSFCNFVGRKLLSCPTAKILMLLLRNIFWSRMLRFKTRNPNTVPEGGMASAWWQWHRKYPICRTSLFDWLAPSHNGKRPKKIIPPEPPKVASLYCTKKKSTQNLNRWVYDLFVIFITIFDAHPVTARGRRRYRLINASKISSAPTHNFGISQIFAHLARNKIQTWSQEKRNVRSCNPSGREGVVNPAKGDACLLICKLLDRISKRMQYIINITISVTDKRRKLPAFSSYKY